MITKTQEEFMKLMTKVTQNYQLIDALRYDMIPEIQSLKTLYSNLAKASSIESQCPSFRSFLAGIGRSYSQATYLIKIGEYITENDIEMGWLVKNTIPISVVEFLRKNKIKWDNDVMHDVLSNDYPQLVKIYGKKKKENKETEVQGV